MKNKNKIITAYDSRIEIINEKLDDKGYLILDCKFARTGTQERYGIEISPNFEPYKKYIEYRPASEVFKPEVIKQWNHVVITNEHPEDMLTVYNTTGHAIGFISSQVEVVDNSHLSCQITVFDKTTIDEIMAGKVELSGGYLYEIELTPNQEYDYVQKNIVPNHIAIVDAGRCGTSCSLAFDGKTLILERKENQMKVQFKQILPTGEEKIIFEIEISDETVAKELQAFADKQFDASKTMYETSKSLKEDSEAKDDEIKQKDEEITAKDSEISTLTAKLDVAGNKTPAKDCKIVAGLAKDMASTAMLVAQALDCKFEDVFAKDMESNQKDVIAKFNPNLKLDGKDSTYIQVAFDSIIAQLEGADADYIKALTIEAQDSDADKKDEVVEAKDSFKSRYGGN